jgi:antitoxin component YwqK of YwqJK toxin-antitoxin module
VEAAGDFEAGNGVMTGSWPNGNLRFEGTWRNGAASGVRRRYWPNGKLKEERNYNDNGQLSGSFSSFHSTGSRNVEAYYKDGRAEGESTIWYPEGGKEVETVYSGGNMNGRRTEWHIGGGKRFEGLYLDGKRVGRFLWYYTSGEDSAAVDYDDAGQELQETNWFRDGTIAADIPMKDGKIAGYAKWFRPDGTRLKEEQWKDGRISFRALTFYHTSVDSVWVGYHENGSPSQRTYLYKSSHRKRISIPYDTDGEVSGVVRKYSESGRLTATELWVDGREMTEAEADEENARIDFSYLKQSGQRSRVKAAAPAPESNRATEEVSSEPKRKYRLTFRVKKNVQIRNVRVDRDDADRFTYQWRSVCGIDGWKPAAFTSATATGGNGGVKVSFSCFDCFKAKRPGHNRGPKHMTEISWVISRDNG